VRFLRSKFTMQFYYIRSAWLGRACHVSNGQGNKPVTSQTVWSLQNVTTT